MNNQNSLFENEEKFLDLIHYCTLCNSRLYEQVLTGFLNFEYSIYLLQMEKKLEPFFQEIERDEILQRRGPAATTKKIYIYALLFAFQNIFPKKNKLFQDYCSRIVEDTTQDEVIYFINQKEKEKAFTTVSNLKTFSIFESKKKKNEALLLINTINKHLENMLQEFFSPLSFFEKKRTYTSDFNFLQKKYDVEWKNLKKDSLKHRASFDQKNSFEFIKKKVFSGPTNCIDFHLKKCIQKTYLEVLEKDFPLVESDFFLHSFWEDSVYSPSRTFKTFFDRYFQPTGFIPRYLKKRSDCFQSFKENMIRKAVKKEEYFALSQQFFESAYFDIFENSGFFDVYLKPLYLNHEGILLNPEFSGVLSNYDSCNSTTIIPLIIEHFRASIRISSELSESDKDSLKKFENALLPKTLYQRLLSIIGFAFIEFIVLDRKTIEEGCLDLDSKNPLKRAIEYVSTCSARPEDFTLSTLLFDPKLLLEKDYFQYSVVLLPRVRLFLAAPNQLLWSALIERFKLQYYAKSQLEIFSFSHFFKKQDLTPLLSLTLSDDNFFKKLEEIHHKRTALFIASVVNWVYKISVEVPRPALLRFRNKKKVHNLQDLFSSKQRFFSLEPRTKMNSFDSVLKKSIEVFFSFF